MIAAGQVKMARLTAPRGPSLGALYRRQAARLLRIALALRRQIEGWRGLTVSICVAAVFALHSFAVAQTPDSLSETYGAWTVTCVPANPGKQKCAMSQTLRRQEGGEQLLLIELTIEDGTTSLGMLTPFGLDVVKGATLQTDEDAPVSLRFSTCLPNGCVVRQTMSAEGMERLLKGTTLKTRFTIAQTGEPFSLTSSLQGFTAAYQRLGELSKGP